MTHPVMAGQMFGHSATHNPYPEAMTANLLPTVVAELTLHLEDWQLPVMVPHVRGRCEPTRMCRRCGQECEDLAFNHCKQCVTMSVEKSPLSQLTVSIKQWEDCSICGESVDPDNRSRCAGRCRPASGLRACTGNGRHEGSASQCCGCSTGK